MKKYYLVVSLTEWTGAENNEIPADNIAGTYNTLDELQADRDRAIETWIASSNAPKPESGKYKPIHIYICEEVARKE